MPISVPGLTAAIASGLASSGFSGIGIPQLALGIASGVMLWLPQVQVVSADTGTLGSGVTSLPFFIPPPLLQGALLSVYPAFSHLGVMAPLEAAGLGTGLALGFSQGIIIMTHPNVGVGTGVAKFVAPPPTPSLLQGFASAGLPGTFSPLKATAISQALLTVFAAYTIPVPIVGPSSPFASGGVGVGKVL